MTVKQLLLVTVVASISCLVSCECDHALPGGDECPNSGFYVYPDPESCSDFWQCVESCAEKLSCPDGFFFDDSTGWCDVPELVDCGERPHPPVPTTTSPPPTTTEQDCGHPFDCSTFSDGWYPDIYNCRKYWSCSNNKPKHYICPEDYLWDADNNWCDYPDRVDCGKRPICDDCDKNCSHQTTSSQPTTASTTTDSSIFCTDHCKTAHGDYELGCCSTKFCKCEAGVGYVYPCPPGLVFVEYKDQCDYPSNVPCCN